MKHEHPKNHDKVNPGPTVKDVAVDKAAPVVDKSPEPASMPLPDQTPVEPVPVFDPGPEAKVVQPPLNFACVYYYVFSSEPWPDVIAEFGKKSVPNQYFLDQLKQYGAYNEATVLLMESLLKDLKGS